ncbi:MAG: hypothetical protein RJA36_244 [Pseudomonadota bacterium]|jgi:protein TonB
MTMTFVPAPPGRSLSPLPPRTQPRLRSRNALAVAAVLAAHAAALWALLAGLTGQQPEPLAEPQVIRVDLIAPESVPRPPRPEPVRPAPKAAVPSQPAPPRPAPAPAPPRPATSVPSPLAPSTAAPTAQPVAASTAPSAAAAPAAPAAAPAPAAPAATAAPKVELPSSSADYLSNPKPPYPPLSKRLNEQGLVVLRVYIEADGTASKAEVRTSSGYERLDQAALQTVLRWRYVPGKRGGAPEAMWFNVPINFVLE